ncbi:hypothetical protein TNCT1_27260 [Streptomyces sp. 1-11]|nr:hypothetical protein TNCT1_27260 [Streptomyces sp. 1-11]
MVVDDQDSDANHETPFPGLHAEQGIAKVRRTTTRADTTPALRNADRTAAAVANTATPTTGAVPVCLAP